MFSIVKLLCVCVVVYSVWHYKYHEISQMSSSLPVYFLSHGGPTFMFNDSFGGNRGCFDTVRSIGKKIKTQLKPKFIICVSGHWESKSPDTIEVGIPDTSSDSAVYEEGRAIFSGKNSNYAGFKKLNSTEHSLYYDFYGFPDYMYQQRFHVQGSVEIAKQIEQSLISSGIKSKLTKRGIDHGVWVPLKSAFSTGDIIYDTKKSDLDIPIIQVSIAKSEDFDFHFKLGQALGKFRDQGGLIITSGASVHNLGDFRFSDGSAMPYVSVFNKKLTEIVAEHSGEEALKGFNDLKKNDKKLLYQAHPTLDHFMPVVVGAGAASSPAKELYTDGSYALGWNVYEWN